jgi:hypothetical protein
MFENLHIRKKSNYKKKLFPFFSTVEEGTTARAQPLPAVAGDAWTRRVADPNVGHTGLHFAVAPTSACLQPDLTQIWRKDEKE